MRTSVIIPYFDAQKTIERTLESVYAQHRKADEVLVVDDGSGREGAAHLAALRERLGFSLVHRENGGTAAARNTGVRETTGDLLAFLDADDIWDPGYLSALLPRFSGDAVGMVFSRLEWIEEDDHLMGVANKIIDEPSLERLLLGNFIGSGSNFIMRRECLEAIGGFREDIDGAEDYLAAINLFLHERWTVVQVPSILVKYRRASHSKSRRSRKMLESLAEINRLMRKRLSFRQRAILRLGIARMVVALNSVRLRRLLATGRRR